ncbi:MAG TPA: hypothetical protein VM432_02695 [Bdellovibrionales bacterium]|nr:hypothetical protein [Bdellovibrionales bacterium]
MKSRSSESGSSLLIVLIALGVFSFIISGLMSRYESVSAQAGQYRLARENERVRDELSKIVLRAYERQQQANFQSKSLDCFRGTGVSGSQASTIYDQMCFPEQNGNCVESIYQTSICLNLSGSAASRVVAKNDSIIQILDTTTRLKPRSFFDRIMSVASAQNNDPYQPNPIIGWSGANAFDDIDCSGASPPSICKSCGTPGSRFLCFEMRYCPANTVNCDESSMLKSGLMIQKAN